MAIISTMLGDFWNVINCKMNYLLWSKLVVNEREKKIEQIKMASRANRLRSFSCRQVNGLEGQVWTVTLQGTWCPGKLSLQSALYSMLQPQEDLPTSWSDTWKSYKYMALGLHNSNGSNLSNFQQTLNFFTFFWATPITGPN